MTRIFQFLDIPPCEIRDLRPRNVGRYRDGISPLAHDLLRRTFAAPNERLRAMLV